jgi:hypothetical protein
VPKLSTLILSWNARETLRGCLRSYSETTGGLDQEIIVVDNGSTDGSAEMVRAEFPSVTLIESRVNLGYAGGNNQAYAKSRGEYILLLNDDVVVPPGTVPALVHYLDTHPNAAGATCRLVNPDGTTQRLYHRRLPGALDFLGSLLHTYGIAPRNRWAKRYLMLDEDFLHEQTIEQTAGTCLLLRRSAIDRSGGLFDAERFPILLNDTDLAKRLRDANLLVWLVPGVTLTHLRAQSTERLDPYLFRRIFLTAVVLYFGKHGTLPEYLLAKLGIALILSVYLAATAIGLTHRYFAIPVENRKRSLGEQWKILKAVLLDERVSVTAAAPGTLRERS